MSDVATLSDLVRRSLADERYLVALPATTLPQALTANPGPAAHRPGGTGGGVTRGSGRTERIRAGRAHI